MKTYLLKHRWIISLVAAALLGACARDARLAPGDSSPSAAPPSGQQYVGIVPPETDVNDVIDDNNLVMDGWLPDSRTLLFEAPTGFDPGDFDAFGLNVETELVEGQNDAISFYEWETGDNVFDGQDALLCLDLPTVHTTVQGSHARVAVLDTGIDDQHPWLVGNLTMVNDPVLGIANLDGADPEAVAYGHGTHVAGVILNVAPGALVFPFKVLTEDGTGTVFDLVAGIDAAVAAGVDVINLSLAVSENSLVVEKAILRATTGGILVVAAAGNDTPGGAPVFPALLPNVIGVAATEGVDCADLASYSAWDPTEVAFGAPGTHVNGAYPGNKQSGPYYSDGTGTSTACAVVTGCVLLAVAPSQLNPPPPPTMDPLEALETTAVPVNPAGSVLYGRVSPVDAFVN